MPVVVSPAARSGAEVAPWPAALRFQNEIPSAVRHRISVAAGSHAAEPGAHARDCSLLAERSYPFTESVETGLIRYPDLARHLVGPLVHGAFEAPYLRDDAEAEQEVLYVRR